MKPRSVLVYPPGVSLKRARSRQGSMAKRRRIDIVADILDVAIRGAKKTKIMRNANLSFNILQRYLEDTLGIGFLRLNDRSYETTEKGREFLEMYTQFSLKYSRFQKDVEPLLLGFESLEKMCSPPIKDILGSSNSNEKRTELKVLSARANQRVIK
jgi:predicted transcriptional regulator